VSGVRTDLPRSEEPVELPRVVSSRTVYQGKIVSLRVDEVMLSKGGVATREMVHHPGAVVIVALTDQGDVYLVEQYRHAVGRALLELPAGGLEPGEEPLATAQRELKEEVGLQAANWTFLGQFFSSPGFANEKMYAYAARGLSSAQGTPDDDEDISVIRYPLNALLNELDRVEDAKTLATLLLLLRQRELRSSTAW
jgi:ADP-ribose pyrophosphatase